MTKRNRKKPGFEKTSRRDQKFEQEVQQNPETFKEIEKKNWFRKSKKKYRQLEKGIKKIQRYLKKTYLNSSLI